MTELKVRGVGGDGWTCEDYIVQGTLDVEAALAAMVPVMRADMIDDGADPEEFTESAALDYAREKFRPDAGYWRWNACSPRVCGHAVHLDTGHQGRRGSFPGVYFTR
jgi:hypothetical protein